MKNIGFPNVSLLPSPEIPDHYVSRPDVVSVLNFGTTSMYKVFITLLTGMIHVIDNGVSCLNHCFGNTSQACLTTELEAVFDEFGSFPDEIDILDSYLQNYR